MPSNEFDCRSGYRGGEREGDNERDKATERDSMRERFDEREKMGRGTKKEEGGRERERCRLWRFRLPWLLGGDIREWKNWDVAGRLERIYMTRWTAKIKRLKKKKKPATMFGLVRAGPGHKPTGRPPWASHFGPNHRAPNRINIINIMYVNIFSSMFDVVQR